MLLDDDFSSIVRAVRLGRRIFNNLRKAMSFLLAVHVPIAGLALLPALAGWPLALLPVHVVFLELIIDPASSIAFEAEPEDRAVMQQPPRPAGARLFSRALVLLSLLQGAGVLLATAAVMTWAHSRGLPDADVRTLTFTSLVLADLGLILANRAPDGPVALAVGDRNPALWLVVGGAAALLAVVTELPAARDLFSFGPLHADDLLAVAVAVFAALLWPEITHLLRRRLNKRRAGWVIRQRAEECWTSWP